MHTHAHTHMYTHIHTHAHTQKSTHMCKRMLTHAHTHAQYLLFLPHSPSAMPVVTASTSDDVATDRDIGKPVLVATGSGRSAILFAVVTADPCPSVQWRVNDTNIGASDIYRMYDPCPVTPAGSPSYYFSLIITVTTATAGTYSAILSNPAGTTSIPDVFVTPPGMLAVKEYV